MEQWIVLLVGALCGVVQFFIQRQPLKPLAEGKAPQLGLGMLLRLPLPLALLLGCAWLNSELLPFAGGAFCVSWVAATIVNHVITLKRKE